MTLFYVILAFHLLAVVIKLGVLFYIPTLKNVAAIEKFLATYKKIDRYADISLWISGAGLVLSTSIYLLTEMWLLVSMLLYTLIFYIIKRVILRRMESIIATNKVHAREEIRQLRFENVCVIITALGLFGAIGALMVNKPF
jgi:uncharacterized membrane protein SirB2